MSSTILIFALVGSFSPPESGPRPGAVPYDDVRPVPPTEAQTRPRRKLGAPVILYVNFDGVHIEGCSVSDSRKNCHWINANTTFPPWSGSFANRVAILHAMRAILRPYGVRVTGVRPSSDLEYAMVVYGGTEEEFGSLGLAPAGDCWDEYPNQIAYAYLDGPMTGWINGGAATAVHEAAHTWGLDHIVDPYGLMAPAGDNSRTYFRTNCQAIVEDSAFSLGQGSCPTINTDYCDNGDLQHDQQTLRLLFGDAYVDHEKPELSLVHPEDGQYFQSPGEFEVELSVVDDLHPQYYTREIWIDGLMDEPQAHQTENMSFPVTGLPNGSWTFHVRMTDEAGNGAELSFEVEVGDDPPPAPEDPKGCGCGVGHGAAAGGGVSPTPGALWLLAALAIRRRQR
jgi:hypothetical protein